MPIKKLLEDNGLQVPETWEEINEMAPALIEKELPHCALCRDKGTFGALLYQPGHAYVRFGTA